MERNGKVEGMGTELLVALIGLGGALVGAFITGATELFVFKRTTKIASEEKKSEKTIQKMEKAYPYFQGANIRFYANFKQSLAAINRLRNELFYIYNATRPENKTLRTDTLEYPHIDNQINAISGNIQWKPEVAELLGSLRYSIDCYNSAVENQSQVNILEERINAVYQVIPSLKGKLEEEQRETEIALRDYEHSQAEYTIGLWEN